MPRGVDSGDTEWMGGMLTLQQVREGAADVAVSDEGDPQGSILAADERGYTRMRISPLSRHV